MKRISDIIFSSKTTIILLILLVVAMGTGTFIEDKYDTQTAKILIYNARWFEFLFLLLALNFIGHIKTFNMFRKERVGGIIFHLAFIIMIIGAGITRYFSYEGMMHIREGESSNILFSSQQYMQISISDKSKSIDQNFEQSFGTYINNSFHTTIVTEEKGNIDISTKEYISNAVEKMEENVPGGVDLLELIIATDHGKERIYLGKGESKSLGKLNISYNNETSNSELQVIEKNGMFQLKSPFQYVRTRMDDQHSDTLSGDSLVEFKERCVYSFEAGLFVFKKQYKSAVKKIVHYEGEDNGMDALIFNVTVNGKNYDAPVLFSSGQLAESQHFNFDGLDLKLGYGKKAIELPFSLHLNDFILERYAGSESPSSYASEVTVTDNRNNANFNHRIFMNNILDYDSYRFFQSSYDQDEQGTVLSVNHDFWGTWVSYIGYILMTLGFLITLLNKNSRFLSLGRQIGEIMKERKNLTATIALFVGLCTSSFAQTKNLSPVDFNHAEKFGRLITQSVDGRFQPVHTLAYDVLHKIARKDKFTIEGKGNMDAIQVFMDMIIETDFWKQQKIIYIKEQSVRDAIGITTKVASYNDFFDNDNKYKIQDLAEQAFRKKPVDQNNFDKEIIRVDERVNIFMMLFQGSILKIFPEMDSQNNKWISWDERGAVIPLKGVINIINNDLQLPELNYTNLAQLYFGEVTNGTKSGDYSRAEKVLGYISKIQRQSKVWEILPSERKVDTEIFYNKVNIFIFVKNCYALISIVLLLLAFIDNIKSAKSKIVNRLLNFFIILLAITFLYHTFGMGLRAYLVGHAPWSNGYEALILVGWAAILAGFSFIRYSKIIIAACALLAFFVLMTAGHSSYDPQLTTLTPVLKSYWLIIHVAVLTISYGFLGLGFFLGIMNLFLYLFKTKENNERIDLLILELTYINEMNLSIGLFLATVGTFLGGVWANESWGRYWGWDAKETWALVIVVAYTLVLHLRFIPKLGGKYSFNVASIIGFASVLMTFFGVNYFLSKGMHSYGAGDPAIFPMWAWVVIICLALLMVAAKVKEIMINKSIDSQEN